MGTQLDCLGLACPQPVIRCRELLASGHPDALCVLVDNTAAVENVSRFLGKNGYTTSVEQQGEAKWAINAVLSGEAGPVSEPEPCTCEASGGRRKTAVLITTPTIGRGDETLGAALMGNFLATLPELGEDLWRVILLNGGVRLACEDGKALEALKTLAGEYKVSIYVCGTCLAHYGLSEAKQIGETTNMLDIVTSLGEADKVIRP